MFHKVCLQLLIISIISLHLGGCAHMAHQVVQPTLDQEFLLPETQVVKNELNGRAFTLSEVSVISNLKHSNDVFLPTEACSKLLKNQLTKAFSAANIEKGKPPAYTVTTTIEEIEYAEKSLAFFKYDYLKVKMTISRPDNSSILVSSIRCKNNISSPVWAYPIPSLIQYNKKSKLGGITKLIPAVSVEITKILAGLKEGKSLDQIEILQLERTTKVLPARDLLYENAWGIDEVSPEELEQITGFKVSP